MKSRSELVIIFCFLILVSCSNADNRIARIEKRADELSARLDAVKESSKLDLQERCLKQATIVFNRTKFLGNQPHFVNHYSYRFSRCVVQMSEKAFDMKTKEIDDVIDLIDPFEGQVIGKFWHTTKTATKVKEQNLVMCFVEFPAESKDCNSRHDFDKLAKEYMAN